MAGKRRRSKAAVTEKRGPGSDAGDNWTRSRTGKMMGLFLASSLASTLMLTGCSLFGNEEEENQNQQTATPPGYYGNYYRSGIGGYFPHSYVNSNNTTRLMSQGLSLSRAGLGGVGRSSGGG